MTPATDAFWRRVALVALCLCGVLIMERFVRSAALTADAPRPVLSRDDLPRDEKRVADLFTATAPSVVAIATERGSRVLRQEAASGSGSGFVWDRAGHIVTNDHVIDGATTIAVILDDGRRLGARLVGRAPWADLAVLRLADAPADLRPISVGTSGDLVVGQSVLAIGNPFGLARTLTTGIISALDRRLPTQAGRVVAGVIQTDAAINPGNSGGPLIDTAGRLIGVNTAIVAPSGAFAGVGFAIPVDTVNRLVPALIRDGRAPLAGIGIVAVPEEIAVRAGIRGVIVEEVRAGSSAAIAGLAPVTPAGQVGDVIIAVNGKPVATVADMTIAFDQVGVGKSATLTVLREGRRRELQVVVQDIN